MVPINYLAVIVSAIAMMALGYLWYGPLFGKQWMTLMGWTTESMAGMQRKGMAKQYGIQALGALLMSFVMAHAIVFASAYLHVSGISAGLMAGVWNWVGFVAPVTVGAVLWDGKPWKLWILNAGYYLVGLLIIGVILSLWQ
jgi:hypothetical protein